MARARRTTACVSARELRCLQLQRALAPPHRMHAARSARRLQRNIHISSRDRERACMCSFNVSLFFFTSVPSTEKSAGGRRGAGLTSEPTFPPRVLMYYYNTVQEYFTVRCNKQSQVSVRPSTASSSCTLQLAASSRSALQHLFEFPSPAGFHAQAHHERTTSSERRTR